MLWAGLDTGWVISPYPRAHHALAAKAGSSGGRPYGVRFLQRRHSNNTLSQHRETANDGSL